MKVDLYPKKCNLCGGYVQYISNHLIYGKKYGSGKCYHCTKCGALVGTHKYNPRKAYGILADKQMRKLKVQCHDLFDKRWKGRKTSRHDAYKWLANELNIPIQDCHFGYFDLETLQRAYQILKENDNV